MKSSSLALLFELHQLAASSPAEVRVSFLSPRQTHARGGVVKDHPCWNCKRQTHPTMEEYEMCCKYDSYQEMSRLVFKAYTLAFLLMATALLWTAGDACLYFGLSYLENRYSGWNRNQQGGATSFVCLANSCRVTDRSTCSE